MTVTANIQRADYNCNGATTLFTVPFQFFLNTEIQVIKTDSTVSPAVVSTLNLGADYSVAGGAGSTGSITTTATYPTGVKISILMNLPFTQAAHYVPNDPFPAATHEAALDRLTLQDQQLEEKLGRAAVLPPTVAGVNPALPVPTANAVLMWDPTGTFITNGSAIAFPFSSTTPVMDGAGNAGVAPSISRGDHQHPSDTSRVSLTALASAIIGSDGASLVGWSQLGTGAVPLTVDKKLQQPALSAKDFGAIADGNAHPISGVTSFNGQNTTGWTLVQWQAVFPFATALTNELDGLCLQLAINAAVAGSAALTLTPGTYRCSLGLTCSGSIAIYAYGATINQLTAGQGGIAFTGTGPVFIFCGIWNGPQYAVSTAAEQGFSFTGASAASPFTGVFVGNAVIQNWGFRGITGIYCTNVQILGGMQKNIYYAGTQFLSTSFAIVDDLLVNNIVGTPNAYGIGFTRNQVDSLVTDPQSSDFIVSNCNVQNVTNWEGLDTHGGVRGTFIGNTVLNCFKGIGVVKAPGATTAYAPLEINILGNTFNSGNTAGTAGVGIDFNGADGTVGAPVQLATGRISGNTIIGYGTSNSQASGALYHHDTQGLVVTSNRIIQPSPTGIQIYHDNYDIVVADNYIEDAWTNTVAGWSNGWGIYCNSTYNTGTINGNDIAHGTKSATYLNTIGIDVSNSGNSSWVITQGKNIAAIPVYDPSNIATSLIRNPVFSGTAAVAIPSAWTATTQSAGDNSTKVATTAYVDKVPNSGNTLPGNPAGTASTASDVMMGLAGNITPIKSARAVVIVTGEVANNTAGDGAIVRLRTGTGTAPTNGAAATGTQRGQSQIFNSVSAAQISGFTCAFVLTGLTLGTANWIDLSLQAVTGGTATVTNVTITAFEAL